MDRSINNFATNLKNQSEKSHPNKKDDNDDFVDVEVIED
jgi:hypothetical protein